MEADLHRAAEGILEDFDVEDSEVEPPTYRNYKQYLPRFTLEGLRARLAARGRTKNQASSEAAAELTMLYRNFRKSVLLVCWAGEISEALADSIM